MSHFIHLNEDERDAAVQVLRNVREYIRHGVDRTICAAIERTIEPAQAIGKYDKGVPIIFNTGLKLKEAVLTALLFADTEAGKRPVLGEAVFASFDRHYLLVHGAKVKSINVQAMRLQWLNEFIDNLEKVCY